MTNQLLKKRYGYIALTTVLVVMVSAMIFLVSTQLITTGGLRSSLANRLGLESYYVAESCLEDTLLILRSDTSYTGGNLNIADGFCTISVTDSGSNSKTIAIQADTLNTYFTNLTAQVDIIETDDTTTVLLLSKMRN